MLECRHWYNKTLIRALAYFRLFLSQPILRNAGPAAMTDVADAVWTKRTISAI